jgi:hypothetical protein
MTKTAAIWILCGRGAYDTKNTFCAVACSAHQGGLRVVLVNRSAPAFQGGAGY